MAAPPSRSIPPSIPVQGGVLSRVLALLDRVETLPPHAVGMLRFGQKGMLLVESRAVCWAEANGMRQRFTQILRYEHEPPLPLEYLQELFRQCRGNQAPLVEALLSTGKISPVGLRAALFRHTAEAIAHLALSGATYEDFSPNARYKARFPFATSEILASLGSRGDPLLAARAESDLTEALVPETTGWAFLRDAGHGAPSVIAVRGSPAVRTSEMLEVSAWATSVFDVTSVFDDDVRIASASFMGGRLVVAWRVGHTYFAAICANRAGAARLVAGLEQKLMPAA